MTLNSTVTSSIEPPTTLRFRNTDLRVDPFALKPDFPESFDASASAGVPGLSDALLTSPDKDGDSSDALHRYRTIWLSDIRLGFGRLPGAVSARFPASQRL